MSTDIYSRTLLELLGAKDNDLCLCRSGKKYKDCHKLILERTEVNRTRLFYELLKLKGKKQCFFQGVSACSGDIVNAHSVSKKYLERITDDTGHVLTFLRSISLPAMDDLHLRAQYPEPVRVGINNASTFPGLCRKHDNDLFACFETRKFTCDLEQIKALHLRSVLHEVHTSTESQHTMERLRPAIRSTRDPVLATERNVTHAIRSLGRNLALRDLYLELAQIKKLILQPESFDFNYLVFEVEGMCPVLVSVIANPAFDIRGELIQDFNDEELVTRSFSFTVIAEPDHYYYVFSWIDSQPINHFFTALENAYGADIRIILIQLCFAYSENSYMRPSWYDSLSLLKKQRLKKLYWSEVRSGDDSGRETGQQLRRHVSFAETKISNVFTNTNLTWVSA